MVNQSSRSSARERRPSDTSSDDNVAIAIAATVGIAIGAGITWLWSRLSSADAVPASSAQQPVQHNTSPQKPSAMKPRFDPTKVERAADNDPSSCVVCLDNKSNCAFQPCQHMVVCSSCAAHCKECPVCREPIRKRLTLFV
ncbi:zinc finger protein, putative [Bodo saltans]|uniref:Zinc finger protein, putative n=1 Tax=Bodo saltans TaxID=75058 RepID=A0A0S4JUW3_BODSA|nr:zinc finger protein, putative [Bodo saltans]|eukprot:CUG93837.1 zinc finger protein, putative [Bodo saltans]